MNFPNNLSILRRRAGYTQEGLAEALNVSRQAVSKWEGGQTMPEAATLLTMADLLHCTLDQLMREELSGPDLDEAGRAAEEEAEATAAAWALHDAYDAHMNRFAVMMASGVALVLAGIAALLGCAAVLGDSGLVILPFFLFLSVAVFLFIFGGISHSDFQKAHPTVPCWYAPEETARFRRAFRVGMSVAVAAILADVALLVGLALLFEHDKTMNILAVALFMLVLAGAVGAIVLLGVLHGKFDPQAYAEEAEREGNPHSPTNRWSGAIMSLATAVFLFFGFVFHAWHPAWVAFPIGGLLCGVVSNLSGQR